MTEYTKAEQAIRNIQNLFPPDMLKLPQWVCWKYDENGRKVPVDPNTSTNARTNDPDTWAYFDTAALVYTEGGYDKAGHKLRGVGFVFTEDDPYAGIDLDDCRDPHADQIGAWADRIVRIAGTYAEVSPSGTGVKLYGLGIVPGGGRKWGDQGAEIYSARRWFAVTGEKLDGTPLEACNVQPAIDSIRTGLDATQEKGSYGPRLNIHRILDGVSEGERNNSLYSYANSLEARGTLVEEAIVLMHHVADRAKPPVLHAESDEIVQRVYNKRRKGRVEPSMNGHDANDGGKAKPPTHDELRDRWIEANPLTVWSRDEFKRYGEGTGLWEHMPEETVEDSVWRILEEAKPKGVKPSASAVASVMRSIRARRYKRPDVWDANPDILVATNGAVDLLTGELLGHLPGHYATTGVPYAYDPEAECPHWHRLLDWIDEQASAYIRERAGEIEDWPDDMSGPQVSDMLQEFAGLALTNITRFERFLVLVGKRGSGKSTFIEGLQAMVGEGRHGNLNIEDIVGDRYGYARIPGKTLLTGTEQPAIFVKHTNRIEALVSGEIIKVEEKYKAGYDYRPVAKILWGMNELPKIANGGAGLFRRILVVRFPLALPEDMKDVSLKERIRAEAPGVLNWALAGLRRLLERGDFDIPKATQWAVDEFEEVADVEARFVEEVCQVGPEYRVRPRGLYQVYKLWCKVTGHAPKTETNVANDWKRLGFKKHPIEGKQYWHGLDIDDDKEESLRHCLPGYMHIDI
jgi:putative DNA primase/helicase